MTLLCCPLYIDNDRQNHDVYRQTTKERKNAGENESNPKGDTVMTDGWMVAMEIDAQKQHLKMNSETVLFLRKTFNIH